MPNVQQSWRFKQSGDANKIQAVSTFGRRRPVYTTIFVIEASFLLWPLDCGPIFREERPSRLEEHLSWYMET
jgi:hypothetical protein